MPTKFFLTCYLSGFLATLAGACPAPAKPQLIDDEFATVHAGLRAVKRQVLQDSVRMDTEYAGAVLRTPQGQFRVSIAQGCRRSNRVRFFLPGREHGRVVALWHTHGKQRRESEVFSSRDALTVRQTGLPFYLITPRGRFLILTPGSLDRKARSFLRSGPTGYRGLPARFAQDN